MGVELKFHEHQKGLRPVQKEKRNWFRKNWAKLKETRIPSAKTIGKITYVTAANTALNTLYGLDIERLERKAKEIEKENPKSKKIVELATVYGVYLGLIRFGKWLGGYTCSEFGYVVAFSHPALISAGVQYFKQRITKNITGVRKGFQLFRANLTAHIGIFSILHMVSTPLFIRTMKTIVETTGKPVGSALAACAVVAGVVVTTAFEVAAYLLIWRATARKTEVKQEKDVGGKGKFGDIVRGFVREFSPFRMFTKNRMKKQAHTVNEEVGQIWGVIESYWIWVQALRVAIGSLMVRLNPVMPSEFIDVFFQKTAEWGATVVIGILTAVNRKAVDEKLKENIKHFDRSETQSTKSV